MTAAKKMATWRRPLEWWANNTGLLAVVFTAIAALLGVASWVMSGWVADQKETALRQFQDDSRLAVANATKGTAEAVEGAAVAKKEAAEANERTKSHELELEQQRERTAKAEARVLELEQRNEPRRLSPQAFNDLVAALRISPVKGKVQVAWVSAGPEPVAYGNRFIEAFKAAGWELVAPTLMMDISGFGVGIVVRDASKAPPYAGVLQQILKAVGIETNGSSGAWVAEDMVQLLILSKP